MTRTLAILLSALLALALFALAGCGRSCVGHGGVKNVFKVNNTVITQCYDGTTE